MGDTWKPIPGLPGYEASDTGEIRGPRGILSQFKKADRYLYCEARGQKKISRLVCMAFHGLPPTPSHHAAHNDGVRTNNAAGNLAWKTKQENADDLARHGSLKGEKHGQAKLTTEQVLEIKRRRAAGERVVSISDSFPHVTYNAISLICNNKNWSHVP